MASDLSRWLLPKRMCTALLIRHAERGHFSRPARGATVPITEKGARDATQLGRELERGCPAELLHSPVGRCRQTAEALSNGLSESGGPARVLGEDGRLGGPYLLDVSAALDLAGSLGHQFVREWFAGRLPSSLLKSRRAAALEQIAIVEEHMNRVSQGMTILVTHDWNLLAVREEFFGLRHEDDAWPGSLDGLVFWREESRLWVATRDRSVAIPDDEPRRAR